MKDLTDLSIAEIMRRAYHTQVVIPAFNICYLPQMKPVAEAVAALDSFALVQVARPDIQRFGAQGYGEVAQEYRRWADASRCRLHQDHVPVVDEEQSAVDWEPLIREALELQYDSVMIDGSRLPLEENIAATRRVVEMAHPAAAVEGELGAVLGHEAGPLPPYEELFRTGRGFTDIGEAERFVAETGVDWLSVAVGNIHGAISGGEKDEEKVEARLNVEHLGAIADRVGVPLVLHGGSGIELGCLRDAVRSGIAKINVATAIRQPYEACLRQGQPQEEAQKVVADAVADHLRDYGIIGSAGRLTAA
jgi:ketose-bisphosphate aldolase